MQQLLGRLGFVYKQPKIVPGKANAEAQQAYLARLEAILSEKSASDPHYYLDGVHPQHNTQVSCGWIKRGVEKQLKSNTGRSRLNINGALNSETLEIIAQQSQTINAQSTIELFKTIEAKHPSANTIYLTADNAKYYKNKLVRTYLLTSKIVILHLPPYSPNLNLIERVWKQMRKCVLYNQYYEKFADFKVAIETFFEDVPTKHMPALRTLLTKNFQIISVT
jgi:transposase